MRTGIILFLSIILLAQTSAQTFEGSIKYAVSTSVDPKIQQASQELNSPANQEKMKMLQEQMKSPEFQKMMEKNPQLKAQMQAMLTLQQGGLESMLPKAIIIHAKDGNTLIKTEGATISEYLHLKNQNKNYQIFRERKVYWTLQNNSKDSIKNLKAIKTNETAKILGYNCTKYLVKDKTTTMAFWTTTEIKGINYEELKKQYQGSAQNIEGLQGFTLKTEIQSPQMKMIMEVAEIKKEILPMDLFSIPIGFTEEKMPNAYPIQKK